MKTQNKVKMIFTVMAAISVGVSVNAWASKIGDVTSKIGFGDGMTRALSQSAVRPVRVRGAVETHYARIARQFRAGMVTLKAKLDQDLRDLNVEIAQLARLGSDSEVVKLTALRTEIEKLRSNLSSQLHIKAAYTASDSTQVAQQKLAAMERVTAGGRPTTVQSAFTSNVTDRVSGSVFVAVARTISGDSVTRVLGASRQGATVLRTVFPEMERAAGADFASVKQAHMKATHAINATAESPEVKAALQLVARNLDPNGSYYLARAMGLTTAEVVALTRMGVPLVTPDGRVPDVSGKLSAEPEALQRFKANYQALVSSVTGPNKAFGSEVDAQRFLSGDFVRVLATSQDFGSNRVSLSERIAGALSSDSSRVEADSPEVREVLSNIAQSMWVAKSNDPRFARQIEMAVKQKDVAELRDLLNKDGKNIFEELRNRMTACARA